MSRHLECKCGRLGECECECYGIKNESKCEDGREDLGRYYSRACASINGYVLQNFGEEVHAWARECAKDCGRS